MSRKCYMCNVLKETIDFHKDSSSQDGLAYYCKACKKQRNSKYYKEQLKERRKKHNTSHAEYMKIKRDECKQYLDNLRSTGCVICGEKERCCLEFHHKDPNTKLVNVTDIGFVGKQLFNELDKCILVCANCHLKIHSYLIKCPSVSLNIPESPDNA